jgi:hypothetical protein
MHQQGRLVDGTNAMTKQEALDRLDKEGGFNQKEVDTIGGGECALPD